MGFLSSLSGPPDIERFRSNRDFTSLIRTLSYKDPAVQCQAVDALGELYGTMSAFDSDVPRGVEALSDIVFDTKREELVRQKAVLALVTMRDPNAAWSLLVALHDESVPPALKSLVVDNLDSIAGLTYLLNYQGPDHGTEDAKKLLQLIGEQAVPALIAIMQNEDCWGGQYDRRNVRSECVEVLGEIGDARAVEVLRQAALEPPALLGGVLDGCVQSAAARALERIDAPEARQALIDYQESSHLMPSEVGVEEAPSTTAAVGACKAFQAGRCVVHGRDTGPCDWNPQDWRNCNVVTENMKYGGW